MTAIRMAFKEEAIEAFKEELINNKSEGPFCNKTKNEMFVIQSLREGKIGNQQTKDHLLNIIKVLCKKLDWLKESEETDDTRNTSPGTSNNQEEETIDNDIPMTICKFYQSGNCKFGRSGKKSDRSGKICQFSHPPICKKFENYGYKKEGCRNRDCEELHLNLCKKFMKDYCKYGDQCKYHHPRKLKQFKESNLGEKIHEEQRSKNVNIVAENMHQSGFIEQHHQAQNQSPFLGKLHPIQQPILENPSNQPCLKKNQMNQPTMWDLLMKIEQMAHSNQRLERRLSNIERISPY